MEDSKIFYSEEKLTLNQLEEFRNLMIDDKVIVGCDEVIEWFNNEEELLGCLIFMWQQQAQDFRNNLPSKIKNWFKLNFITPPSTPTLYKGMHFKKGTNIEEVVFDKIDFTSTTYNIGTAIDFAYGFKNCFKEENCVCAIYKVVGESYFFIDDFRDMGEKEYIVYNPRFELFRVLD